MHRASIFVMCWWGFSRTGLCGSASMGLLGVYSDYGVGVCGVLMVFFAWFVVFSSFLLFFVLVLVRAFPCPRHCMIYYEVSVPLHCWGPIGTL